MLTRAGRPLVPTRHRCPTIAVLVVALAVGLGLAWAVHGRESPLPVDAAVMDAFRRLPWPPQRVMSAVVLLGDPLPTLGVALVIAVAAAAAGRLRGTLLALAAPALAAVETRLILQPAIHRVRGTGLAFPSGHTVTTASVALVAVLLLLGARRPRDLIGRLLVAAAILACPLVVAAFLLALDLHDVTDTVGAFSVALVTVLATALVIDAIAGPRRGTPAGQPPARSLRRVGAAAVAAALVGGLLVCLHSDEDGLSARVGATDPPPGTEQLLGPRTGPPGALRPVADWKRAFDARAAWEDATIYGPESRSPDSWDHYNLTFGIDGFLAMYRATSQRSYLDTALGYAENLVASARPSRDLGPNAVGDDYLGWITERPDEAGTEVPLFESFVWRYVADVLRVIRTDPSLWADPGLRARYGVVLAFAERNVVEKWVARGIDDQVYRENVNMAVHWAYIAADLARITDSPQRRALYTTIVHSIDRDLPNRPSSLRGQLSVHPRDPSAYFWSDEWGSHAPPGQDVAHGNGVVAYVLTAHELGGEWTQADIGAFTTLLRTQIWHPRGGFAAYVDGADSRGNGWISDGFMKLGRYDPAVQRRLEVYDGALPDNRGGEVQFLGNGALNARFLTAPGSSVPGMLAGAAED